MIFELKKKKNSNKIVALDLKLSRDNPRLYCLYRLTCHQSQKKNISKQLLIMFLKFINHIYYHINL